MEIVKDIPVRVAVAHKIERIVINIEERKAYVHVDIEGQVGIVVEVGIMPIYNAATTTQKAVIRGFIKEIIAQAVQVGQETLPEIFQ